VPPLGKGEGILLVEERGAYRLEPLGSADVDPTDR
jgi:hypothetical protein